MAGSVSVPAAASSSIPVRAGAKTRPRRWYQQPTTRRHVRNGLLFISPWLIGFCVFTLYPFVMSFYYSLTIYDAIQEPAWAGLQNYRELIRDPLIWKSLWNTIYYVMISVPLSIGIGLLMALLLNMKLRGMSFFRVMLYLPTVVPFVASSLLWLWLFDPQFGVINYFLSEFGIHAPAWLVDPQWAKPALIVMGLWGVGGSMILYLAALQDVPVELYESAEIDGANWWSKTVNITFPMISPVILYTIIMGLIGAFQYFTQAYVVTEGGPDDATLFYSLYLYNNAFQYFHMGYASAMAWVLFVVILLVTLITFRSSARWIFYGGEQK
jgi:multiple sugar transport system permease protein